MTNEEKRAARGGLSAEAVKMAARERDGYVCTRCGMTEAAHREKYGTALEVHRLQPGSLYTLAGCATMCRPCNAAGPRLPHGATDFEQREDRRSVCVEIDFDLLEEVRRHAEERGHTVSYVILRALRRHMDHPPPLVADPPLPAGEPEPGAAKKAVTKKAKK